MCQSVVECVVCLKCVRIAELEEQNKMSVYNLASIFGTIMMNVDKVRVARCVFCLLQQKMP